MDGATEDIYFQKIEEFVQDEDRIVTCQTLSESLQITLEGAKILLGKYVDDQKEVQTNTVAATYLLAGVIKSGNYGIRLLDENRFNSESLSQEQSIHKIIYSAQKCLNINSTLIAATQKPQIEKLRTTPLKGSIVGKNCVQRIISKKNLPSPPTQKIVDKQKASFFCKTNFKTEQAKTQETCNKGDSKKKEPKANGIASFFKGSTKVIPAATIISNSKPIEKVIVESTDGIVVEKQAENKINVNGGGVNSEKDIKIIEKENKKVNGEDSIDSKRLLNDAIKEKKIEISKKASHESTPSKPKKRSRSTSNKRKIETETKKRKRIKVISDSESDDMFGSDNDDTINVTESDEETKPVPVQSAILAPKNKKRRAVDKTYQDEEGYIVTKTEYIYESASEDEVEAAVQPKVEVKPKPPIEVKPKPPVENVSPPRGNGKTKKNKKAVSSANQPTLMNFFKKK